MVASNRESALRRVPALSVMIPASNEEGLIGTCLEALLASEWPHASEVDVIVIANGCNDQTASVAATYQDAFADKGWALTVLDRKEGGKLSAMNAGDRIARSGNLVYLDADVVVTPPLIAQISDALDTPEARYASGAIRLAPPETWVTQAYGRIYNQVPFIKHGVPGAGLFAVNAAGRLRWGDFPNVISDDTFVRLNFRPEERVGVPATYMWPLVEGWSNLVRVRKRQNIGVDEIKAKYPELINNDDKPPFPLFEKLRIAVKDPVGFAVYAGVALAVRMMPGQKTDWSRGR